MTSKLPYRLFMSLMIILSVGTPVGCSTLTSTPIPMTTSAVVPTKTSVPSATITSTPEPSPTATLVPTVALPIKAISSENITQIQQLDARDLADKPEEFLPRSMDFTPDGRMIAADFDTVVYVWNGLNGQPIVSMEHSVYLWNVAISPDGKMVASGDDDSAIKLWDVKTGEIMHTFTHHGTIWSLAFSLDNSLLASASLGLDNVRIWNLVDSNELDRITDVPVNSLAFSPDGKLLAMGTYDKIILWDIFAKSATKTFEFNLRGGEGMSGIQGVIFSPDGKMIAAADADNIAMVWDISSGKRLSTIVGKGTIIRLSEGTLAFSPDSKMIAAGNDNGDVIFWDVVADKELQTIGSQTCIPVDLIFGTGGNIFEIACQDGTIQFWGLP